VFCFSHKLIFLEDIMISLNNFEELSLNYVYLINLAKLPQNMFFLCIAPPHCFERGDVLRLESLGQLRALGLPRYPARR